MVTKYTDKEIAIEELKEKYLLSQFYSNKPKLKNLFCSKVLSFADYDCQFISGDSNQRFIVEAKLRTGKYNENYFIENGIFIEVNKYNKIKRIAEEKNATPLYLNYTSDGTIIVHNLQTAIIKEQVKVIVDRHEESVDRYVLNLKNTELSNFNINQELADNQKLFEYLADKFLNNNKLKTFFNQI